jgi:predicted NUDIX family NTP pyrophosphohydrolase
MITGMTRPPSAGVALFRRPTSGPPVEVLIGHFGGPLWQRRDESAWTFPKGEVEPGEELLAAARREFTEELGLSVPPGELLDLGSARQGSGKVVTLWALRADLDVAAITPGTFTMVWPPRSGQVREFPEIDRVAWCDLATASRRLVKGQRVFLDRLTDLLGRER